MAGGAKQFTDLGEERFLEYTETFSATGNTDPLRYERSDEGIVIQLSGTATSFTAIVERATLDPGAGTPNWAPADSSPLSGNASTGIAPVRYDEPVRGWWRVRITALSGGNLTVYIAGKPA